MKQLPAAMLILAAAVIAQGALQSPRWAWGVTATLLAVPLAAWGIAALLGMTLPERAPQGVSVWPNSLRGRDPELTPAAQAAPVLSTTAPSSVALDGKSAPARLPARRRRPARLDGPVHPKGRSPRRDLPPDLRAQVSVIAHLEGKRPGQVIEQAVRQYLAERDAAA